MNATELAKEEVKAEITQLPLRLAWAITVHKSWGMSLDAAEVDLSQSFVAGMGYVALSRLRTLGGLKLLGFNDTALQVDDRVVTLDEYFQSASQEDKASFEALGHRERKKRQKEFVKMRGR